MSKRPGKRTPGPRYRQSRAKLTPQQDQFCEEFFRAPSAAQAAIRAGYAASSAKQTAYDLQRKPHIAKRLAEIGKALEEAQGVTQPRLEREVAALAFSDLRDIATIDDTGEVTILQSTDWSPAAAAAVKKIRKRSREFTNKEGETTATVELEVELHPKLPAAELLGRLRKWLRTDTPFGGGDGTGRIIPAVALPPLRQ